MSGWTPRWCGSSMTRAAFRSVFREASWRTKRWLASSSARREALSKPELDAGRVKPAQSRGRPTHGLGFAAAQGRQRPHVDPDETWREHATPGPSYAAADRDHGRQDPAHRRGVAVVGEKCTVEGDVRIEQGATVAIGHGELVEVRQEVGSACCAAPAGIIGAAPEIAAVDLFLLELGPCQVDALADLLDREAGPPCEILELRRAVAAEIGEGQALEG